MPRKLSVAVPSLKDTRAMFEKHKGGTDAPAKQQERVRQTTMQDEMHRKMAKKQMEKFNAAKVERFEAIAARDRARVDSVAVEQRVDGARYQPAKRASVFASIPIKETSGGASKVGARRPSYAVPPKQMEELKQAEASIAPAAVSEKQEEFGGWADMPPDFFLPLLDPEGDVFESDEDSKPASSTVRKEGQRKEGQSTADWLVELRIALDDPTTSNKLDILRQIRRHLSRPPSPPAQEVVAAGLIATMVEFIKDPENAPDDDVVYEATWIITNISSSEATAAVVEAGAIPFLVTLQRHPVQDVVWQAAWALGNIAGNGAEDRDRVVDADALENICMTLTPHAQISLVQNGSWAIGNLFRWKPLPSVVYLDVALPKIKYLLEYPDRDVNVDAMWALSHVCQGDFLYVDEVCKEGFSSQILNGLNCETMAMVMPSLRAASKIVEHSAAGTADLFENGSLADSLKKLLAKKSKLTLRVKSLALQLISDVVDFCPQHHGVILPVLEVVLVNVLSNPDLVSEKLKVDALFAIFNYARTGNPIQVAGLFHYRVVEIVGALVTLDVADEQSATLAVDVLSALLDSDAEEVLERLASDGVAASNLAAARQNADSSKKGVGLRLLAEDWSVLASAIAQAMGLDDGGGAAPDGGDDDGGD